MSLFSPRRPVTLLLVRGKLGDSLAAWPSVRSYADRHPEEEVWLAIRKNYAFLFADEPGIRLLPYGSSIALQIKLLALRWARRLDKFAVLWGFGKQIPRLARLSGATERYYLDTRFGEIFNHIATELPNDFITDASWRVARLLDPALPRPTALNLSGLAAARQAASPRAVCIVPVADEARRLLGHEAVCDLVQAAKSRFPDAPLWLLGNPQDRALQPLLAEGLPADLSLKPFPRLEDLVAALQDCRHLLTTDTGVYHLAVAMGVPATVFFGPTQPAKIVMPNQQQVDAQRLPELGETLHCDVKDCTRPRCLHLAVAQWSGSGRSIPLDHLPNDCLLTRTGVAKENPCAS